VGCTNDAIKRSRNPGSLRKSRGTNGVVVTGIVSGMSLPLYLRAEWVGVGVRSGYEIGTNERVSMTHITQLV
jgi:hypothetical protein